MNPAIKPTTEVIDINKYEKLRVHAKPLMEIVKQCKKINKLSNVYKYLQLVHNKQVLVSMKYKYPIKAAIIFYQLLIKAQQSVKSKYGYKSVRLYRAWVTKGQSRGVQAIPRARGQTSPKYLTSTNLYVQLESDEL